MKSLAHGSKLKDTHTHLNTLIKYIYIFVQILLNLHTQLLHGEHTRTNSNATLLNDRIFQPPSFKTK